MCYDKLGYPIQLGDLIAYSPTGKINTYSAAIRTGIVKKIQGTSLKAGSMVKWRDSDTVINLKYLQPLNSVKNSEPELFI